MPLPSELPFNPDGSIYHISLKKDEIAPRIILVGDPQRAEMVAEHFDSIDLRREHREFKTIRGTYKGKDVMVIGTGIGVDNVEIVMVELYALNELDMETVEFTGGERMAFIRVGTCGSPQKDIPLGSLAITRYAMGMDNLGYYYPYEYDDPWMREISKAVYASSLADFRPYFSASTLEVVEKLAEKARDIGRTYYSGITVASPGFYAPQGRTIGRLKTPAEKIQEIYASLVFELGSERMRIINNEMESSILNRISNILGYRSGVIATVLANRNKGEFISKEEYRRGVEDAITVALEAIVEF